MAKVSTFGKDFLQLALRIDKHIKGYVDFYIGPRKLRKKVHRESLTSPNTLLNDSNILINQLGAQGYDKGRERYLEKLLVAMKTSIEDINGVEIPFKEKFLRLYDVDLKPVNESELDILLEDINEAYKGSGSLDERMKFIRETRKVPENKVYSWFKEALSITKLKTKELFGEILPKKERILIKLVKNKDRSNSKFPYYEWYLGNYFSRIDINPNFSVYWSSLLSSAAHEGYPGHHTHFVINEKLLYQELNQFEHSILILNSPKLILCEGIADIAVDMLFSYRKQAELSLQFCVNPTHEDTLENLAMQNKTKASQSFFWYILAYHALFDEWSKEKLIRFANGFEIFSQKNIKNILELIFDPTYSTTVFLYNLGANLIKNKYGGLPSAKNYLNLLLNPLLPSDLM